jgi:hypothetical protein
MGEARVCSGMAHLSYIIFDQSSDSSNFPDADNEDDNPDTEDRCSAVADKEPEVPVM